MNAPSYRLLLLELSAFEFLDRLPDLVPPLRRARHRYHGVFASDQRKPGQWHVRNRFRADERIVSRIGGLDTLGHRLAVEAGGVRKNRTRLNHDKQIGKVSRLPPFPRRPLPKLVGNQQVTTFCHRLHHGAWKGPSSLPSRKRYQAGSIAHQF
jgi:hypothetical protein